MKKIEMAGKYEPEASFTLLYLDMKVEQKLSISALLSHCSTVKTEILKHANESA